MRDPSHAAVKHYGWWLMVTGKLADLGVTWYALVAIPAFIEGNPLPAIAYEFYGVLGLVVLNGLAIVTVTLAVEIGTEYLRRRGTKVFHRTMVAVLGYWAPGLLWSVVAISNLSKVQQAQSALGL